ncbi:hypothetical protein HDA40_001899 [Hamadaea flava]|uniref:HEAT repeat protein n=1 Tax=Hamadaea flava TaxID=1742688 RepID=A0ABV8LFK3_9ACTN|nr:hypothetical protein [Hamadaea flava]MCP2323392.1 hypothetical protein [Hamadaea flava]
MKADLVNEITALDELTSTPAGWFVEQLTHSSSRARYYALMALARRRSSVDHSLGALSASLIADAGEGLQQSEGPWAGRWPACRLADRLAEFHPEQSACFLMAVSRHRSAKVRHDVPQAVARLTSLWRAPMHDLWTAVADALAEDNPLIGWQAAEALANAGAAARPHADALVAYADRSDDGFGYAVAALARIGDPRAVRFLRRRPVHRWWPTVCRPVSVLAGLRAQAGELLPALRKALSPATEADVVPILAAWGPASGDAVPELVSLLDGPRTFRASAALGLIGPQAQAAAPRLARLALDPEARVRCPSNQAAAWAHWRITGDPELALHVMGAADDCQCMSHPALRYLAELGPLAHASSGSVRGLLASAGAWTQVEAAYALWRITGDPAPSVPVLMAALVPRPVHRWHELAIASAGYLAEMGDAATAATPLLERLCAGDRRLVHNIIWDEALTEAASSALTMLTRPA